MDQCAGRFDDGDHRREVDINVGSHGADAGGGLVPEHKAQGGGPQAQVEDVEQHFRRGEAGQGNVQVVDEHKGDGEDQPPEKDFAGGLQIGVPLGLDDLYQHPVSAPGKGRAQGEQVAQGAEPDGLPVGEGNQGDAPDRDHKAGKKGPAGPGRPAAGPHQQGGEHCEQSFCFHSFLQNTLKIDLAGAAGRAL